MPTGLLFLLCMAVFFLVSLTIVFRVEKRMVWPYGDPEPQPPFNLPHGYAQPWVSDAVLAGFKFLGWSRDLKGASYRIAYAMLVSADRSTFAVVGEGSILNMKMAGTWLHTPSADGRSFYTTDNQAGVQIDLSRDWTNQLCTETSFQRLWARHQAWIKEMRVIPSTLTDGRELEEFRAIRRGHYQSMANAGLIQFTDPSAVKFQFTLLGAARTASFGYFVGISRRLTSGRFPRNA